MARIHRSSTRNLAGLLLVCLTLFAAAHQASHGRGGESQVSATLAPYITPTASEVAIVDETLARFGEHGLTFATAPVVSFHDDKADCAGNLGYWIVEDGTDRVRICWTHDEPGAERILRTQALVHELAHAWVHRNTDASDRAAFVELVGADSWNAGTSDWVDRGTEVAAELVTWAILDPAVLFIEFDDADPQRWALAYELLTGRTAPDALAAAA